MARRRSSDGGGSEAVEHSVRCELAAVCDKYLRRDGMYPLLLRDAVRAEIDRVLR